MTWQRSGRLCCSESLHEAGAAAAAAASAAGVGAAACCAEADVAAPAGAGVAHHRLHAGDDAHVVCFRTRRGADTVRTCNPCGDPSRRYLLAHEGQWRVAAASVLRLHTELVCSCTNITSLSSTTRHVDEGQDVGCPVESCIRACGSGNTQRQSIVAASAGRHKPTFSCRKSRVV